VLKRASYNFQSEPEPPKLVEATRLSGSDNTAEQIILRRDDVQLTWTEDSTPQLDPHTVDPTPALLADVASEGFTAAHPLLAITRASAVSLVGSDQEVEQSRAAGEDLIPYRPMQPNYSPCPRSELKPTRKSTKIHDNNLSSSTAQSVEKLAEAKCFAMEGILYHREELAPSFFAPFQFSPVPEISFEHDELMGPYDLDLHMEDPSEVEFSESLYYQLVRPRRVNCPDVCQIFKSSCSVSPIFVIST